MLILRRLMVWPLGQTRSLSRSMGRERHERLPVLSELRMEHWSPVSLCAKLLRKTCRADKKLTRSYHGPPNKPLDFFLVLNTVASVASIAGLLWLVYDRFIAPRKRDANDSAGIYIAVRRPDGTVIDIFLGRDVLNKEDFIHRFELLVGDATHPD